MSARRLLTCALAGCIAVQMSAPAAYSEAGGAIGGGGSEVSSWVVGQGPGGGVTAPSGTTCGPWDHAANLSEEALTALNTLGAALNTEDVRSNYFAIAGVKGAAPGTAAQVVDANDACLRISLNRDRRPLAAAVDWVQIGQ